LTQENEVDLCLPPGMPGWRNVALFHDLLGEWQPEQLVP